ncbi:hypothetical protein ABT340_41305 [Streptosporangium sp. NPDC000239]|uniref:hypothetical protein n=1 Tax=Streptosporangium sp. NPDC000239 TaxID=3154248 RepID=UPI003330CBF8
MTTTDAERSPLLDLLSPFPDEYVGKLPRIICPVCSKAASRRGPECGEHKKERCSTCNSYISTRHIHLDYVGHADVTRRLLEIDPEWSWEPVERDVNPQVMAAALATGNPDMVRMMLDAAPPKFDLDDNGNPVGLWIYLTVLGVRRRGYGSCPSNQSDAAKVLIGDALRNAAMRFGVALDLWAKGDRADPAAENAVSAAGRRAAPHREQTAPVRVQVDTAWVDAFEKRLAESTFEQLGGLRQEVLNNFKEQRLDSDTGNRLMEAVKQRQAEIAGTEAA